ncbi:MAG: hypothetical protein FWD15_03080 [Alphaproteobacteria bacterium]|nr:hypothetical protein [Alphaproteobacteria bacterium]
MKKLLSIALVVSACASIRHSDLTTNNDPISPLLTPMEVRVDQSNLENVYSRGTMSTTSNRVGVGTSFGNLVGSNNNFLRNMNVGGSTGTAHTTFRADPRINDITSMVEREFQENIMKGSGITRGQISFRIGYSKEDSSIILPIASVLTLGVLNFFGMPFNYASEETEIVVEIRDNAGTVIRRYREAMSSTSYVAMWWGFSSSDAARRTSNHNVRDALQKIRRRIDAEAADINKALAR